MIPDFAIQVEEIQRQLGAQAETTQTFWLDAVAERYYNTFINEYDKHINLYLDGGSELRGKGLNELLEFIDKKMDEMQEITGVGITIEVNEDGEGNDFMHARNQLFNEMEIPQDLRHNEISEVMKERDK